MEKLVFLVTLLAFGSAERGDLSGRVFTFPVESNSAHVRISPETSRTIFTTTVCLRYFTDIHRTYALFSVASPSSDNNFLLYKTKQSEIYVYVNGGSVVFWGLNDELNQWHSVCATWDSSTGLAQVWLDGKPSTRKSVSPGGSLDGVPSIVLGQEQDSYGGGFVAAQSFVGSLTDIYMWDSVLSPQEIQYYMQGIVVRPGNVLNWRQLEFTRHGSVVLENNFKNLNVKKSRYFRLRIPG